MSGGWFHVYMKHIRINNGMCIVNRMCTDRVYIYGS